MKQITKRVLSLLMVIALLAGFAVPVSASGSNVTFTQVDNNRVSANLLSELVETPEESVYADSDIVRVSIVLEGKSTIEAGFSSQGIAQNAEAMAYRAEVRNEQAAVTASIEKAIGTELDVARNLTLAANIISANVLYGQIETIEQVKGVEKVLIETQYQPDVVSKEETVAPNMATSSKQIGSALAWNAGYTGAGSRIAIVDTGADVDHQSLNEGAYLYSLAYQAGLSGLSIEEYIEKLDLLDAAEIASVSAELNVPVNPNEAFFNAKIPYGYNYVDEDYDILHINDAQGEHGSHVAGIATANAFVPAEEGTYVKALDSVAMQGVAPDAQLIVMKVFGKFGGAYDSDYMAAIEDAVILGADAVNLSLGSGNPGMSRTSSAEYQAIMDNLVKSGTIVAMSAGNSGSWVENAYNLGYLYADDVSMQTNGSPGSLTNSLSVASVDNDGLTGAFITVGGNMVVYNETSYKNAPFTTIAGDHEYVLIDAIGEPADWEKVADVLEGKIALCYRGTTSFYQKAVAAVDAGATATFIINNQAGVINMDLTDYPYTQPVASLNQVDGEVIKAASTVVTDDAGNVLYYTGTMTVAEGIGAGQFNSEFYTMSSFSSWGVPGSLELKPEITAPGGSIYSIFGETPEGGGGDQYELMSGTSMASPQVAGMAALVAQYIRENGLEEKTGLDARTLGQSLLMSTAVPMFEAAGMYYPVLRQGAGLGNVGAVVTADSYILMDENATASYADGKVKAELGDDPQRTGEYTFDFTINNLADVEKSFALSADFFIQAPVSDGTCWYMNTITALIGADVTWMVNGTAVEPDNDLNGMDFNADGTVNSADGQALLDYVTGVTNTLNAKELADLDADGDIDTYDAYLFLSKLTAGTAVVPANGSVKVTVKATLPEDWKETIEYYYPNGTYIQGYVYAESLSSAEGVEGTSHSIPVLAFYGNWSDASMFDVGSRQTYATGEETRIPYLGNTNSNTFAITYADEPGVNYYFGGNPLVPDETYLPERNAINSENGDTISKLSFIAIRNAAASRFTAVNKTTGETQVESFPGAVDSAYYYVNGAQWRNTGYSLNANFDPSGIAEGSELELALTLATEYYVDAEGNVAWDKLGEGATLAVPMVVDNTAPELFDVSVSLTGNTMTVTASDNQYVAAVALYNKAGTSVYTYDGAKAEIEPGEKAQYVLDLNGVNGKKFLLQVVDYAMNTTTYEIEMQIGEEAPLPDFIAYDLTAGRWTSFHKHAQRNDLTLYAPSDVAIYAATIVDHIVLAADEDGTLYAMPEDDLTDVTVVGSLGTVVTDMAYNKADGQVYAVDGSGNLVRIDKLTGATTVVGPIGVRTNTLACDADGTFFCNGYASGKVYSFTLDTMDTPEQICDVMIGAQYVQAMEINPNDGKLYWNSYWMFWGVIGMADFYEIDTKTGEYIKYADFWNEICGLIIPEKKSGDSGWAQPTDEVTGILLAPAEMTLLRGNTAALNAVVQPWTATDRTVTWTSGDEAVATVDANGVVTAVGAGSTTVTATSNLDPSFSATCTVNVEVPTITLEGALQDADGNPQFFTWNMEIDDTWTAGTPIDTNMTSATIDTKNNKAYIMDANSGSWGMHLVDPATGTSEKVAANGAGVPLWDMEYSNVFSTDNAPLINGIYNYYFLPGKDPMAMSTSAFGLDGYLSQYSGGSCLVAIASMGHEIVSDVDSGEPIDTEHILMLDDANFIWDYWIYPTAEGYSAKVNFAPTDLTIAYPGDAQMENMYTSMVVGEDGYLYLSAFTGETNELFRLSYNAATESYDSARIGNVGQGVWPAILTGVTTNGGSEGNAVASPKPIMTMKTQPVSAEELAAAAYYAAPTAVSPVSNEGKAELLPNTDFNVEDGEKTVTVTVTTPEAATNGLTTVSYDTSKLALENVVLNGTYTAKVEEDGKLTFGYVSLTEIPAEGTIATLTFTVKEAKDSTITVEHKQVNNAAGSTETLTVEFQHENTEIRGRIEPGCTTAGYTGDTYCTDCGQLLEKGKIVEALGHTFGEWKTSKPATCTEGGEETRTCSVCGVTETRVVPATGHSFGEWTVTKEATCTENGVETRTCACGETEERAIAAHGHDALSVVVAPTCTEEGYTEYTCQVCGHIWRDNVVPATGHNYEAVVTAPTCTEPGYTTYTCSVCGDSYVADEVPATGHTFGEWEVTTPATCTEEGVETRTCACGETETRAIPAYCPTAVYTDVPVDAWYHEAVDYVVENGLMNGMSKTVFAPSDNLARAQLVMVLYRMAGSPSVEGKTNPFVDVAEGDWYYDAVTWAFNAKVIKGISDTVFAPNGSVSREQIATVLFRYTEAEAVEENALEGYTDADQVSEYAQEAMNWAVANDLITGVTETALAPRGNASRAQIATILMRYMKMGN